MMSFEKPFASFLASEKGRERRKFGSGIVIPILREIVLFYRMPKPMGQRVGNYRQVAQNRYKQSEFFEHVVCRHHKHEDN
jgi:predicted DCC family thiol-disulfide oxidoreductase YuxK